MYDTFYKFFNKLRALQPKNETILNSFHVICNFQAVASFFSRQCVEIDTYIHLFLIMVENTCALHASF